MQDPEICLSQGSEGSQRILIRHIGLELSPLTRERSAVQPRAHLQELTQIRLPSSESFTHRKIPED